MGNLTHEEEKLVEMLRDLPYNQDPAYDIPNNKENLTIATVLMAGENNCVDEYIDIIKRNPNACFEEIMRLIYAGHHVEFIDSDEDLYEDQ